MVWSIEWNLFTPNKQFFSKLKTSECNVCISGYVSPPPQKRMWTNSLPLKRCWLTHEWNHPYVLTSNLLFSYCIRDKKVKLFMHLHALFNCLVEGIRFTFQQFLVSLVHLSIQFLSLSLKCRWNPVLLYQNKSGHKMLFC